MANAKKPAGEVPADQAPTANSDPRRTRPEGASSTNASPSATDQSKPKTSKGMSYFKSRAHGLSFVTNVDRDDSDPTTAVETVRFQPFYEMREGDEVKVGYLATDDPKLIKRLQADGGVEEIDKDEYEKATDTERERKPARRAPY